MIHRQNLLKGSCCNDTSVSKGRDASCKTGQRVDVVSDHDDREIEFALQGSNQFYEILATVGVQARGRFVQSEQFRLQRQGARQSYALDHTAGQLGGHQSSVRWLKLNHGQLHPHQLANQFLIQPLEFAQRKGNVVENRQGRKQRTVLKQHAETAAHVTLDVRVGAKHGVAEQPNLTFRRLEQANDFPQQGGLATAGPTNQPEHLATMYDQINVFMHLRFTETGPHALHVNDRWAAHNGKPTLRVKMAKSASTRITTVIEVTTELVVLVDRLSVFGLTRRPK